MCRQRRHGVQALYATIRANNDSVVEVIQEYINKCKDLNSDDPTGLKIKTPNWKINIQSGLKRLAEQNPNLVFCSTTKDDYSYCYTILVINKSAFLAKTSVSEGYRVQDSKYYDLLLQWESGKVCLLNTTYCRIYSKDNWHAKAVVFEINKQLKDSRQCVVDYEPNRIRMFTIGNLTNSMEKMWDL